MLKERISEQTAAEARQNSKEAEPDSVEFSTTRDGASQNAVDEDAG